jgi:hypothetical protein
MPSHLLKGAAVSWPGEWAWSSEGGCKFTRGAHWTFLDVLSGARREDGMGHCRETQGRSRSGKPIRHYLRTHRESGLGAGNSTEATDAANPEEHHYSERVGLSGRPQRPGTRSWRRSAASTATASAGATTQSTSVGGGPSTSVGGGRTTSVGSQGSSP